MGNEGSQQKKYGEKLENDVKITWEKISEVSNVFPGRDGHCACAVKDKLYAFGGVAPQAIDSFESNELLCFDFAKKTWSLVEANGAVPAARSAGTMAAVGSKLYLFGGLSRETGWFDTLHQFDTETSTWSQLAPEGTCPCPRDKLASAVISKKIYIFGGFGPQGMEDEELEDDEDEDEDDDGAQFGWFNDLFVFDTETCTFSSPMQMNLGVPSPRAAHGMCSVDKYLVIFGGRDAEARQNDLHIFDTESRKWMTDLVVHGRQPEPRSFHTLTTVGDRVVVLGGRGLADQHYNDVHIFDTAKQHWLQPKVEGAVPCERGIHTATVVGDNLVLFGGSGAYSKETMQCSEYYNDLHTVPVASVMSGRALPRDMVLENQENIPSNTNVPNINSKAAGLATATNTSVETHKS